MDLPTACGGCSVHHTAQDTRNCPPAGGESGPGCTMTCVPSIKTHASLMEGSHTRTVVTT